MIKTYKKEVAPVDPGPITTRVTSFEGEIFIECHDKLPGDLITYDGGLGVLVSVLSDSVTVMWTRLPLCDLEMKVETIETTSRKLNFTWTSEIAQDLAAFAGMENK